jgi:hypothetical protein
MSLRLNTTILSASQIDAAETIRKLFLDAGFSEYVAAAAIVNAFRESLLDPKKKSKTGRYVGLFMLSPDILASERARQQADLNTLAIINEALNSTRFMNVAESEDLWELVAAFSTYVERPRDKDVEESQRILASLMLYPEVPAPPSAAIEPAPSEPASMGSGWGWAWAVGGALVLAWMYKRAKQDDS